MQRLQLLLALAGLSGSIGCALCASPHDDKFAAYGGAIERVDFTRGRVASLANPAEVVSSVEEGIAGQGAMTTPEPPTGVQEPAPALPEDSIVPPEADRLPDDSTEPTTPSPLDDLPDIPSNGDMELPELGDF